MALSCVFQNLLHLTKDWSPLNDTRRLWKHPYLTRRDDKVLFVSVSVCQVAVVWDVKLVRLCERGWYRSREPGCLRGAKGPKLSPQTGGCARQDEGQSRPGEGWRWCRGGTTSTLIPLKLQLLGHTRGPPNFTLLPSTNSSQRNRNTWKQESQWK